MERPTLVQAREGKSLFEPRVSTQGEHYRKRRKIPARMMNGIARKEDQSMQYRKPEIVNCKRALEAVYGVQKGMPLPTDSNQLRETSSAYEADE